MFDALRRYTKPANLWDLYAFSCDPSTIKNDSEPKWRLLREYFRLFRKSLPQLRGAEEVSLSNDWWRLTRVNSSYSLCSTYPSELIVPRSIRYFMPLIMSCGSFILLKHIYKSSILQFVYCPLVMKIYFKLLLFDQANACLLFHGATLVRILKFLFSELSFADKSFPLCYLKVPTSIDL